MGAPSFGPNGYRSLGPLWVENSEGDVLSPSNGVTYDLDPSGYKAHLREVCSAAAARAGIAACHEILWRSRFPEEPDWNAIRRKVDAQHRVDNAAA